MVNKWIKKGKFLYEHKITKSWIGIKKQDIDYYKKGWVAKVKRPNGDIESGMSAKTQKEILKKVKEYMREHPSKAYQYNYENKML